MPLRIAIGTDHGGFNEKNELVDYLDKQGYTVLDCGTYDPADTDYPIYATRVARNVSAGAADCGVIICKAGNGMAITANRFPGVRAGIATDANVARLAREHNNANVLVMGAEHMGGSTPQDLLDAWLGARFDSGGRHERRVGQISAIDRIASSSVPTHKMIMAGQSPWLDDISDTLITSGRLKQLVEEAGLRGVTSNPSIFQKSVSSNKGAYPDMLADMKQRGLNAQQAYEEITINDVGRAADIMRPVYDETGRDDGYVSLEVEPQYGNDEDATVSEALRLFRALDRPNVFIKIPATKAGIPAIRRVIAEGVNVNVTLMFSLQHYRDVAQAYIDGLRDRVSAGKPIHHVRSVASVFISRLDVKVKGILDEMLGHKHTATNRADAEFINGKIAVANAVRCYDIFQEVFYGDAFADLTRHGGTPQRPLWASTSTKTKGFSDVYYIERMVAPYTVNTIPTATFEAVLDHAHIAPCSLWQGQADGEEALKRLAGLGIDIDTLCDQLQVEGLEAFADAFDSLYKTIEEKLA